MKIGILETGRPPDRLAGQFPSYARMVERLIGPGPGHAYVTFAVTEGALPPDPAGFDAYVVTGSRAGVYDDLPWIAPLIAFLRGIEGRARLVGICFGHQIMAEAFGGRAAKSDKGWGLGLHVYDVVAQEPWMDKTRAIAAHAIHQDQVVALPPGARILASSAFTPHGLLAYDDRRAISIQTHPEFDAPYARALISGHRPAIPLDERLRAKALASLGRPNDNPLLGAWIGRFLEQS